jgi:hypothetical protein
LYALSVSEESLQDQDLYELLPEVFRSNAAQAVCAALDAHFGCLTHENAQLILERTRAVGLRTEETVSTYVPASLVLLMIEKAFKESMENFFDVTLTGGVEVARRKVSFADIKKGLQRSAETYFDVETMAAAAAKRRGVPTPASKQIRTVKNYIDHIVHFGANDPFLQLVDRLDIRVTKCLSLYTFIRGWSEVVKRCPPERLLGTLGQLSDEVTFILANLPKP